MAYFEDKVIQWLQA